MNFNGARDESSLFSYQMSSSSLEYDLIKQHLVSPLIIFPPVLERTNLLESIR